MKLWHYTTVSRAVSILDDGEIKTTEAGNGQWERPVAWFSAEQFWEPTATKVLALSNGTSRQMAFDEMRAKDTLIRFGVDSGRSLVPWSLFTRIAGVSRKAAGDLEDAAQRTGADCLNWYCSFEPVPVSEWSDVQVLLDSGWTDIPDPHIDPSRN
jgi:hypothetical protein